MFWKHILASKTSINHVNYIMYKNGTKGCHMYNEHMVLFPTCIDITLLHYSNQILWEKAQLGKQLIEKGTVKQTNAQFR